MTRNKDNPHIGSSFDDFLEEEEVKVEVTDRAVAEVAAWQLAEVELLPTADD